MARLLLSCDDYVYLHKGRYYAGRQDLIDFYQRYLRVFDRVRLVARCVNEQCLKPNRVPLDCDSRIEYIPVPEFHGPKEYAKVYFNVGRAITEAVSGCDAAVVRIPSTVALRVGKQAKKVGIPYACEVVFDAQDGWKGSTGINRIAWKRIDKQMKALCAMAEGVSCVTEHYLQQHYYSLKKGAFTSNYSSLSLPAEFYSKPKNSPKELQKVIAHISNHIEYDGRKGHVEIIKAISVLKKRGVDLKVKFAGRNQNGGIERLQYLAKELGVYDKVEFVGYLSRKELDVFLCETDLYVMPTRAEGLPRVIIEAMAKGLPCISTPVSGNPELLDDHFLVPYENVELLADRIEELCTDAILYEKTSRINFERSKKYEASILESRRDEFYKSLKNRIITKITS